MAYLKLHIGFFDHVHQLLGFFYCIGQRLFNKYMLAFSNGCHANLKMMVGWNNHINNIAGIHQFIFIHKSFQTIFGSNLFGSFIVRIKKTNQLNTFDFLPVIQMKLAQMANTKNSYFQHIQAFYSGKDNDSV